MKNGWLVLLAGTQPPWDARRDWVLKLSQGLELGNMIQFERQQSGTPEKSPNLGPPIAKTMRHWRVLKEAVIFVEWVSGDWMGKGLGRDMVAEEWEGWPPFSGSRGVVWEQDLRAWMSGCRDFCTQGRGLTEEIYSERNLKARDAYKRGPFCFVFHQLPRTPQNSLWKGLNRVWCSHSGRVTGLHPVEGMLSAISPPTQDLAQPRLGKGPHKQECHSQIIQDGWFLWDSSLPHFILHLLCGTVYPSMAQISLGAIFLIVPELIPFWSTVSPVAWHNTS